MAEALQAYMHTEAAWNTSPDFLSLSMGCSVGVSTFQIPEALTCVNLSCVVSGRVRDLGFALLGFLWGPGIDAGILEYMCSLSCLESLLLFRNFMF